MEGADRPHPGRGRLTRAVPSGVNVEPPPESSPGTALLSAMTTEHFVLQSAISTTYAEASARSTLYVMALSSSLVAVGFLADKPQVLVPFLAVVLPALFVLGVFTFVRLVETSLESIHYLRVVAQIRAYYRGLGPEAARQFDAKRGRWPEITSPAQRLGTVLAFLGTTASMVGVINSAVAGVGVALLVQTWFASAPGWLGPSGGAAAALVLCIVFYRVQRWRFADDDDASTAIDS
jgi:hypothetical protein